MDVADFAQHEIPVSLTDSLLSQVAFVNLGAP